MYAVIKEAGSFQHRVEVGQVIQVQKLPEEVGSQVEFNDVMLVSNGSEVKIGQPFVNGAKVKAEVLEQERGDKISIIKFKRRKHHMKHQGHRQYLTKIKITSIDAA